MPSREFSPKLRDQIPESFCYRTIALKTTIRLEFHHMVKFQTDACPIHCYNTLCMKSVH